ncbi:MAG: hypothetical protein NTV07_04505 [Candidatus Omnitrophica bacterium]|nr:hypothetical protein [Candidatus Omnitrophota bacterium]
MQDKNLATSIQYMKGVGPKRAQVLGRLGLSTVEDLLYNLPARYEDRSNFTPISRIVIGQRHTLKGKVLAFGFNKTKKGISFFQVAVGDNTGVIYATWFNQPYVKKFFKVGQNIILYGKVDIYDKPVINQPEYEIFDEDEEEKDSPHIGRIVPVYPLTKDE